MKRLFLVLAAAVSLCAVVCGCGTGPDKPGTFLWDGGHLAAVRRALAGDDERYTEAFAALTARADRALTAKNPSVMDKIPVPASGDRHDYMSMGRYFWPNPDTPDGLPYVSRDGESNPELERYDRNRLGAMADGVRDLALAAYLSPAPADAEKYAEKAVSMLRTWFLDEATRMNPNMTYAQMVPGHNNGMGRQYGIIDGYSFVAMLDGVMLLDALGAIPPEDLAGLRRWFAAYSAWLVESDHGRRESATPNNHSIAYDVQLLMYSLFGGELDTARRVVDEFPARRLQTHIRPDGSQPEELVRTIAYWYSVYNVAHMLDVCDMARGMGVDLYSTVGADGSGSIARALRFLEPYLDRPEEWPWQQINDWGSSRRLLIQSFLRAARHDPGGGMRELYDRHADAAGNDGMLMILNM